MLVGWMAKSDVGLTEIVDEREETGTKEHGKNDGGQGVSVLEQTRGESSLITLPELDADEDGNHSSKATEETDDTRVVPGIFGTTPLQSKEQADDGRDEDGGASKVEFANAIHEGHVDSVRVVAVNMDEEEDDDHGEATDGEVDVETPTPGCVLGKCTSKKGTGDRSDTPHATNETKGKRTLLKRHWSCG